jgi:hypothetical protein
MISLDCAVCRGVNSAMMFLVVDYATVRVIGGANVPTSHMRVDATWPLALLEIAGPRLSLSLDPWTEPLDGFESEKLIF